MNENGKNKREWVKTAAIIFLSVMLVLTFFSQSIMNYSLPEVATSYVQSGTITAKIRGTGTVESGDPYEVKVNESRKVASVAVRTGDFVQKGDVLLYLEDEESDDLKQAKADLEAAQNEYDLALLNPDISSSNIFSANEGVSSDVYRQQITNAQAVVARAEKAYDAAVDAVAAAKADEKVYQDKVDDVQKTIDAYTAQIAYDGSAEVAAMDKRNVETALNALIAAKQEQQQAVSGGDSDTQAAANAKVAEAQKNYDAAVKVKTDRENTVINLSAAKENWVLQKYLEQQNLEAAQKVTADREAAVETAKAEWDAKVEELDKLVKNISNIVGLEQKLEAIDKAQQRVDELISKSVDATVTAPISGTVSQISVIAGNTTQGTVMTLQPEGAGYTLSFSVTNEQAKRLSVGDKADLVNAWRYDDVEVTLAKIKPDKQEPGQKKELVFNVTGDVTAGQSFNVSVGQKSANYDLIVPNSAIREDSNGKFILIVETKANPLGNRYMATRVDVEVLASDDTQSAIAGGVNAYEYVITTSNKPVEAGQLVRLPE